MIYEIRDYTIEKEWLELINVKEFFLPYAKNKINIIDFWAYDGIEAEVEKYNDGSLERSRIGVYPNDAYIYKNNNHD